MSPGNQVYRLLVAVFLLYASTGQVDALEATPIMPMADNCGPTVVGQGGVGSGKNEIDHE